MRWPIRVGFGLRRASCGSDFAWFWWFGLAYGDVGIFWRIRLANRRRRGISRSAARDRIEKVRGEIHAIEMTKMKREYVRMAGEFCIEVG